MKLVSLNLNDDWSFIHAPLWHSELTSQVSNNDFKLLSHTFYELQNPCEQHPYFPFISLQSEFERQGVAQSVNSAH